MTSPYADLDRPPLSESALGRALARDDGMFREIRVVEATPSTNADVAAAARAGEPEGLVVVAETQTAGRGRLGRAWHAPPRSSLMLSMLLRPEATVPVSRWSWLPLLAGVALVDAVREVARVDAALKWPNDLLVGDLKCAGILAEVTDGALVLGLGLNVTTRSGELPGPAATSLLLAGAQVTDRFTLLRALLRAVQRRYDEWCLAAGDAVASGLLAAYRHRCRTLGRRVRVELPDASVLVATAREVDASGRLVVVSGAGAAGVERAFAAGDVVHVRAGD